MMRHKDIEKLIQKRLDREITKGEEICLFQHLSECPECNSYYQEMEMIHNELGFLIEVFPNRTFNARVIAHLGIKRNVLPRLVPAFLGIYLVSLIFLLFSPLSNYLFPKLLFALPAITFLINWAQPIINGIVVFVSSDIQAVLTSIFISSLFLLMVFYAFVKILKQKEEKWIAQNSY